MADEIDLINRDPNGVNSHLGVSSSFKKSTNGTSIAFKMKKNN